MATFYSERRWWHYVSGILGCLVLTAIGVMVMAMYHQPRYVNDGMMVGVMLVTLGCIGTFGWLSQCAEYTKHANTGNALALIEKGTARVVETQLQRIRLSPWPFRQRYRTKQYPMVFVFSSMLHPITINPKVIPLSVRVVVTVGEHADVPDWFVHYLADPVSAEKVFLAEAFEVFQHRLPQELANRLNPFKQSTVDELREYVEGQLRDTVSFPLEVRRLTIAMAN